MVGMDKVKVEDLGRLVRYSARDSDAALRLAMKLGGPGGVREHQAIRTSLEGLIK